MDAISNGKAYYDAPIGANANAYANTNANAANELVQVPISVNVNALELTKDFEVL